MGKTAALLLVLPLLMALCLTVSKPAFSATNTAEAAADISEVLVFLQDVVGLDVEKYEVTLTSSNVRDNTIDDSPIGNIGYIQTSGVYMLVCWDTATETYSELKVLFSFANATLRSCTLKVLSGEPYYSKPLPSDTLEAAKTWLERYEASSGDAELTAMGNMLTIIDLTKDSTVTDGNLKLQVTTTSDNTLLRWIHSQNGVDYNSFNLEFKNGFFLDFFDSRSYRTVGSTEVNISKEQAIDMALEEASDLSYTYSGELVSDFNIVENQIRAELKAGVKDKPTLLYPCWLVYLPLDHVYPGFIYYILVEIWADTGQVISCREMGYGGVYPDESSSNVVPSENPLSPEPTFTPEPTPTASPTEEPQQTEQDMTRGAILAVTSIVVFLGLLLYFIKRG